MSRKIWSTAVVGLVGLSLLLIPTISEAQKGGRGGGRDGGRRGGDRDGGYRDGGRGYGYGFGWGLPGYYPGYYGGYGNGYYNSYDYVTPGYSNSQYYPQSNSYSTNDQSSYYPGSMFNQLSDPNDAGFVVRLPDPNAEVWFQDHKTQQRGAVRHYESGNLEPNNTYQFQIRARWTQNGQQMDQTRTVNARAGQNVNVDFTNLANNQGATDPNNQQNQRFQQDQNQQFQNQQQNPQRIPTSPRKTDQQNQQPNPQ